MPALLKSILFGLVGETGELIEEVPTEKRHHFCEYPTTFRLREGVPHVTLSERQLLNQIVAIGADFKALLTFIDKHECPGKNGAFEEAGRYIRALCSGLDEYLDSYRQTVLHAEQDLSSRKRILNDISVLGVLHKKLNKHAVILPHLVRITDIIVYKNLKGGQILNLLASKIASHGIVIVQEAVMQLQRRVNEVLFNELSSFIVYGIISDPYGEFFIAERGLTTDEGADVHGGDIDASLVHWLDKFELREEMVPRDMIGTEVANKILFVGQAVRILLHSSKSKKLDLLQPEDTVKFATQLHDLKRAPKFDLLVLESELHEMKRVVGNYLWKLVRHQSDIQKTLMGLRDFYLLGKGEFWQTFLDEAQMLFSKSSPGSKATRDLNIGPLQDAAMKFDEPDPRIRNIELRHEPGSFMLGKRGFHESRVKLHGCVDVVKNTDHFLELKPIMKENSGSVWYGTKVGVANGFECTIRLKARHGVNGLALVLQNNSVDSLAKTAESICGMPSGPSLSITFQPESTTCRIQVWRPSDGREGFLEREPLSKEPWRCRIPLFDGEVHEIKIKYSMASAVLRVTIDGENNTAISQGDVDLSAWLKLKVTGRSWVGITWGPHLGEPSNSMDIDDEKLPPLGEKQNTLNLISWSWWDLQENRIVWDEWEDLAMSYRVEFPCNIVIRDIHCERYNVLFRWFLLIKRVHYGLLRCRSNLMARFQEVSMFDYDEQKSYLHRKKVADERAKRMTPIWMFFNQMHFFLSNVQYYLQIDVLDSEFNALIEIMEKSDDIEALHVAHERYLHRVCVQSFVYGDALIRKQIRSMLKLITQFTAQTSKVKLDPVRYDNVMRLAGEFRAKAAELYRSTEEVASSNETYSHLMKLVTRLDFNRYFSGSNEIPEQETKTGTEHYLQT